jgi:hypothetical protein
VPPPSRPDSTTVKPFDHVRFEALLARLLA